MLLRQKMAGKSAKILIDFYRRRTEVEPKDKTKPKLRAENKLGRTEVKTLTERTKRSPKINRRRSEVEQKDKTEQKIN